MRKVIFLIIIISCIVLITQPAQAASWITGYYQSAFAGYEPVVNIPWAKYTHIVNASARPYYDSARTRWTIDLTLNSINQTSVQFINLAHTNGVKAILSIADDWSSSSHNEFLQATTSDNIGIFVDEIVNVINAYGFDGVDLDWEANVSVSQYANLLSRLHSALGQDKLLTMAAGDWNNIQQVSAQAQSYLDQINIMCYDFDWDNTRSWHNTSIFWNNNPYWFGSCDSRTAAFVNVGIPKSKIGIGIPFYGRRWVGITEPLQTGGTKIGQIAYRVIVTDSNRWQDIYKKWDSTYRADYLSISPLNEFISYTGTRYIQEVVEWGNTQGFGGFMVWALDYEFLQSQSGDNCYPLSTALYSATFGNGTPPPTIIYGDISGDGSLDSSDASMAAQYSLGLITLTSNQITLGDVSGDTKITAYDAALIILKMAGTISKFPIE